MVVDDRVSKVSFEALAEGDCFKYHGGYYIKVVDKHSTIDYQGNAICKYYGADLESGILKNITDDVQELKGKIIIG